MNDHSNLDEALTGGIAAWANTTRVDEGAFGRIITQGRNPGPIARRRTLQFAAAGIAVIAVIALVAKLGPVSNEEGPTQAGFVPAITLDRIIEECERGSGEAIDVSQVEHLRMTPGDAWALVGESGRRESIRDPEGCLEGRLVLASFATPDHFADRAIRIEVRAGPTGSTSIDKLCALAEVADDGECFDLGGSPAQISEIGAPPANGYVIQWITAEQMEISVVGLGMNKEDVRALAETVTVHRDGTIAATPTDISEGFEVFADQPVAEVDNRERTIWKGNFHDAQNGGEITLVVTDPANGGPFDHTIDLFAWIELRGTSAIGIPAATYASAVEEGQRHPGSYIEWEENGRTIRLSGTLTFAELTAVANELAPFQ
jgi:hypothetical protein